MQTSIARIPPLTRSLLALATAAVVAAVPLACSKTDDLEVVRQRQELGDYEGTIEPLRALLAERPDDSEVNFLYGRALAVTQRNSLATWPLRKAMEDPKWTVEAGLQLAYSSLASADFNVAVDVATIVLEKDPDNVAALMMRANANAHWRRDPELAIADSDRVLELNPDAIEAFEPRILALLVLEKTKEAREAIAELGRRIEEIDSPETTQAWYCATSAIFEEESEQSQRAEGIWDRCLAAHPTAPEVVWPAVSSLEERGDEKGAVEVLRRAWAGAPGVPAYRFALADRLRLIGEAAEGEALLREATETADPQAGSAAWLDLARFLMAVGDRVEGTEAFERALELTRQTAPPSPQLEFEYADALVMAGRIDRAEEVAQELTVPAHRHLILARVAQERGNPARALEEFDEGVRLWPDNPWARYYVARAAEDVGDFERALEEYRSTIRIDPAATNARTRAAELLVAEGEPREAMQLVRAIDKKPLEPSGQLLALRLLGRYGSREQIEKALVHHDEANPGDVGRAWAEAAAGVAQGEGASSAVGFLRGTRELDFDDPSDAPALRALTRYAHEAGQPVADLPELRSALKAQPKSGSFHAIQGLALELSGQDAAARGAYTEALNLDPDNADALAGLGRLAAERDPEQALALFDRAAAADPEDPELKLAAAKALLAAGRREDAAARLDALLREHPFEAEAASLRVSLDLEREVATDQTLERARRAARFGGGAPALELLSRVYALRDQPELAEKAAARARVLVEGGDRPIKEAPSAPAASPGG